MSVIGNNILLRWLCVIIMVTFHFSYAETSNETMIQLEKDVTGGVDANIGYYGKFAFVIGTLLYEKDGEKKFYPIHNCGASMIQRYSPILLVTAAHCVKPIKGPGGGWTDDNNPNEYWAFRGWTGPAGNVQFNFGDFRAYRIEEVYFPEAWRKSNQPIFADVAILRLDSGESGRYYFNIPISTPQWVTAMKNSRSMVNPDSDKQSVRLEITGWGMESGGGDFARTVKSGSVWYLSRELCNKMIAGYKKYLEIGGTRAAFNNWVGRLLAFATEGRPIRKNVLLYLTTAMFNHYKPTKTDWVFKDEICALDIQKGKVNTCYGDSGGPLAHQSPLTETYTLVGVTSSAIVGDCEPKLPVMYSSLHYYTDWIRSMHACIMLGRLDEWKNVDETAEYNHWNNQAKFWHNDGDKGCVPDMVWRANRNRATEPQFKKWYVDYMTVKNNYRPIMQEWCDLRDDIEGLYASANTNQLLHELEKPGFFPMMVEFTEWPEETREEKYRRAWGRPTILYAGFTSLFTMHWAYVLIEDNLSVSLDIIRGTNYKDNFNTVVIQIYEIMKLQFAHSRLELLVGPNYEFFCSIPWWSDTNRDIHIEVALLYLGNQVTLFYDGRESCNAARAWRPSGQYVVKNMAFGQSGTNHQNGDPVARNIEFRSWTDPPVCCDRHNKGDGKCMTNCNQAKDYTPKVCTG